MPSEGWLAWEPRGRRPCRRRRRRPRRRRRGCQSLTFLPSDYTRRLRLPVRECDRGPFQRRILDSVGFCALSLTLSSPFSIEHQYRVAPSEISSVEPSPSHSESSSRSVQCRGRQRQCLRSPPVVPISFLEYVGIDWHAAQPKNRESRSRLKECK